MLLELLRDHFRSEGYNAEIVDSQYRTSSIGAIHIGPPALHVKREDVQQLPVEIHLRGDRLSIPVWRRWNARGTDGQYSSEWMKFLLGAHTEWIPLSDPDAIERVESFLREILGA